MRRTIKTLGPLGVAGIMMSLGLTSCTQPAQQPTANAVQPANGSTSPAAPVIPLVWADGTRVVANAHNVDQARAAIAGQDFTEEFSTKAIVDSTTAFQVESVDGSGTLVGIYGSRQSEKDLQKTGQVIAPDTMLIGRYTDGTFESFTVEGNQAKKHHAQVSAGITVTESGAFWVEDNPGDSDVIGWKLLGVSPGTTEVRVLATSSWKETPDSYLDMSIINAPVLIDDRAYWSVEYWNPAKDLSEYKLLSVDLANPMQVREEIGPTDTEQIAPAGALYAWGDKIVSTADVPDDSKNGTFETISAFSAGGQREEVLRLDEAPAAEYVMRLMGSDARGFAVNHDEDLYLIDPNTRQTEVFQAPKGAAIVELNQCGPRVSWSYTSDPESDSEALSVKRYVYNRDSRDLSVVTTASSVGMAHCFGEYMSWPVVDPADPKVGPWDVVTRWKD